MPRWIRGQVAETVCQGEGSTVGLRRKATSTAHQTATRRAKGSSDRPARLRARRSRSRPAGASSSRPASAARILTVAIAPQLGPDQVSDPFPDGEEAGIAGEAVETPLGAGDGDLDDLLHASRPVGED